MRMVWMEPEEAMSAIGENVPLGVGARGAVRGRHDIGGAQRHVAVSENHFGGRCSFRRYLG